jgi:hypothetical protein
MWTDEQLAELARLFDLSNTGLAGSGQGPTRYERMVWTAKKYSALHPEISGTAVYKQLERQEAWRRA